MNAAVQRICIWCGPALLVTFFGGFVIAGFLPPTDPSWSAEHVKHLFDAHQTRIRIGLLLTLVGSGLVAPFVAVVSVQLKRIEGRYSPLTYAQLALGVIIMMLLMIPMSNLMAAAFRADRAPQSVLVLTDPAWVLFVGCVWGVMVQYACVGLAVLRDPEQRILPRWYGYLCFWCAIGSIGASGMYFVKNGPLAWNAIIGFWLAAIAFGAWMVATVVVLLRAVAAQQAGAPDALDLTDDELDRLAARLIALRGQDGARGTLAPTGCGLGG